MKKEILIAALLLYCGLVHAASAAKTDEEVRKTLDETFTGSLAESVPLQTALMSLGKTTGLDFRLKLPILRIEQSVKLALPVQMTVKDALDYLAKQADFIWKVSGGCIEIAFTAEEKDDAKQCVVQSYFIGDIQFMPMKSPSASTAISESDVALSDYIKTMVAPKSWDKGSITFYRLNKSLIIRQTEQNHLLIGKLLQNIRAKNRTTTRAKTIVAHEAIGLVKNNDVDKLIDVVK